MEEGRSIWSPLHMVTMATTAVQSQRISLKQVENKKHSELCRVIRSDSDSIVEDNVVTEYMEGEKGCYLI